MGEKRRIRTKMKKPSGKTIILEYLKQHLNQWVHNQELRKASGLNDTPRVIRTLKQEGWEIKVRGDGYNRLTSLRRGKPKGIRKAISRRVRFEVFHRDGFRCRACGRGPEDGVKLEPDHIIPVDWGGKTELKNLQTLCEECNAGKQAWVGGKPPEIMRDILSYPTVEKRIEALFEAFPNQEIPSPLIQLVSKGALDWQRALRKIREKTGKKILPTKNRRSYFYYKSRKKYEFN